MQLIPREDDEMKMLSAYLRANKIPFTHIANERMANINYKRKLKAMGMSKGFPDMLIFLKNKMIAVEMKRAKKSLSKVAPSQKEWIDRLNSYGYCVAKVCYGFKEAKGFIEEQE